MLYLYIHIDLNLNFIYIYFIIIIETLFSLRNHNCLLDFVFFIFLFYCNLLDFFVIIPNRGSPPLLWPWHILSRSWPWVTSDKFQSSFIKKLLTKKFKKRLRYLFPRYKTEIFCFKVYFTTFYAKVWTSTPFSPPHPWGAHDFHIFLYNFCS